VGVSNLKRWSGSIVLPVLTDEEIAFMVWSSSVPGRAVAQATMPRNGSAEGGSGVGGARAGDQTSLCREELSHDIRHELATIMVLASLLESAPDVGPESRQRAHQLLAETRWLDQLQRAYDEVFPERDGQLGPTVEPIRLDLFAAEVVRTTRLSTSTTVDFMAGEAWAHASPLAFWRALRNVVGNAVRAAGSTGRIEVTIKHEAEWVVVQVDDDGPGFGALPAGSGSLGLGILQRLVTAWGGYLEIGRGALGGCRVRLCAQRAWPSTEPDAWVEERAHAAADL
jgi:signal transduction histidine kinase